MAGSLNKVQLIGNLGKNPEIKTFENGGRVANFSVATSSQWKDKQGQKQERTEWHNVAVFSDGLVTIVEKYLNKGSKVFIEGSLQTRKWLDKHNQDRYTTEIVIKNFSHQIIMLGSNSTNENQGDYGNVKQSNYSSNSSNNRISSMSSDNDEVLPDDDIPF